MLYHPEIVQSFKGCRHFVSCEPAQRAEDLALLILQVLGSAQVSGENVKSTLHRVLSDLPPTLIFLDNFETPWNSESSRSEVEDILTRLGAAMTVSLIITTRISMLPTVISWTHHERISPLSPIAAEQTFFAINSSADDLDESEHRALDILLKELDYIPLAIRLLAAVGQGYSPSYLLQQWAAERTSLLHIRDHRLDSVDVSISLSLSQLSITQNPEAIQLLGVLALLSDGLNNWTSRISDVAAKFERVHYLIRILQQTSLVALSGEKLTMLSPIRHYILAHHPPDSQHIESLETHYWTLIRTYATRLVGIGFPESIQNLDPEIGNVVGLIRNAIMDHPSQAVIDVTIDLSWYFSRTVPSMELLTEVRDLAERAYDPSSEARWYHAAANNLFVQSRYSEAKTYGEEARNRFAAIDDDLGVAQCSRLLGEILLIQWKYDEGADVLMTARDIFIAIGDGLGAAQCCQSLGEILRSRGEDDDATIVLQDARQQFVDIGDIIGIARCSKSLAKILYVQGKEVEAVEMLLQARDQSVAIGDIVGAAQCSRSLGVVLSGTDKYAEASAVLNQARGQYLKIGDRLGAARSLQALGNTLRFQQKLAEAHDSLTEAHKEFSVIEDNTGIRQCNESLADIVKLIAFSVAPDLA